jgi:hypothetical protein
VLRELVARHVLQKLWQQMQAGTQRERGSRTGRNSNSLEACSALQTYQHMQTMACGRLQCCHRNDVKCCWLDGYTAQQLVGQQWLRLVALTALSHCSAPMHAT